MSPQGHSKLGAEGRSVGAGAEGAWRVCSHRAQWPSREHPTLEQAESSRQTGQGWGVGWGAGSRGSRRVLLHFLDSRKAPGASGQAPDRGVFILLLSSTSGAVAGPTHAGRSLWGCPDLCVCWGGGGRKEGPTASWHSGRSGEPHGGPGLFGGKQAAAVATPSLSPDPLRVSV